MTVKDAMETLGARVLVGEDRLDQEVRSACGSDMMSDVLAFSKDHSILLTGLCNPQVIRTAEMLDIVCIIFVRGKKPDEVVLHGKGQRTCGTSHRTSDVFCLRDAVSGRPRRRCDLMEEALVLNYEISGDDFTRAGEASSDVKKKLKQMGVNPEAVRKVAIAMYEGEINMVIHANGGTITVEITPEQIRMILDDTGPGIPDVDLAMQAGYSTAPDEVRSLGFGAGMGLPNMKKYTDTMEIDTRLGVGTKITMVVMI